MALQLLQGSIRVIIYDCIDELTAIRSAPRQLVQRESVCCASVNTRT